MVCEVAAELRSRLRSDARDAAGVVFEVNDVEIDLLKTRTKVKIDVSVSGETVAPERWAVTLTYTGAEARALASATSGESLDYWAFLVRAHLHEWWHTKKYEEYAQRQGTRLE